MEKLKTSDAPIIKNGTSFEKRSLGVCSNNWLPATPPATLISIKIQNSLPVTGRRYTRADAIPPGSVMTEDVAFAMMGSTPANTSAGKIKNVPPPAKALATPAAVAAASRMIQERSETVFRTPHPNSWDQQVT